MALKTAAAYIRVSTDDQLEYSPESQLRMIREYAGRTGYVVPDKYIFTDEGISGRRADKRPGFMRMISVAKTSPRPFDAILLWKFSRFARSRQDSIVYKSMLRRQLGIEVLSVSESLGDDKISVLIEAVIEAMDEYYSVNLAEEVRRGMTEKARRGEPLSIAPFGYRLENKRLTVIPSEAPVIEEAFSRYAAGDSPAAIARALNTWGVRSHRGGKIEARTVEYWLNNPVYIGKIRWTPNGRLGRDFSKSSLVSDGNHTPIISPELWTAAQERLAASAAHSYRFRAEPSHWLVGLVRCGICGGAMVNCRGYFYCGGKSRGLCAGARGVRLEALTDAVLSVLDFYGPYFPSLCPRHDESRPSGALLVAARERLRRAYEVYEAGIDSIEEYGANKSRISAEITALEKELSSPPPPARLPGITEFLRDGNVSHSSKNAVLRLFLRKVTVGPERVTLEFFI